MNPSKMNSITYNQSNAITWFKYKVKFSEIVFIYIKNLNLSKTRQHPRFRFLFKFEKKVSHTIRFQ
jgi:pullulanase/glycogen debranching enzyme